jgi:hypothetical protein
MSVISGTLTEGLSNQKPDTLFNLGWLSTGSSVLLLLVSNHGLGGYKPQNQEIICMFLVSIYLPIVVLNQSEEMWNRTVVALLESIHPYKTTR